MYAKTVRTWNAKGTYKGEGGWKGCVHGGGVVVLYFMQVFPNIFDIYQLNVDTQLVSKEAVREACMTLRG